MKFIIVCLMFVALANANSGEKWTPPASFSACVAMVKANAGKTHTPPTPNPKMVGIKACLEKCPQNSCEAQIKTGAEANRAAVKTALAPFKTQFQTAKAALDTCLEAAKCSDTPLPKTPHTPDASADTHCEKEVMAVLHGPPSACAKACFPARNASASGGKGDKGGKGGHHGGHRRRHGHLGCFKDFCSEDIIKGCETSSGISTLKTQAKAAVKAAVKDNFASDCSCLLAANPKPAVSVNCNAPTATECSSIKAYFKSQHPRSKRSADADLNLDEDDDQEDVESLLD